MKSHLRDSGSGAVSWGQGDLTGAEGVKFLAAEGLSGVGLKAGMAVGAGDKRIRLQLPSQTGGPDPKAGLHPKSLT